MTDETALVKRDETALVSMDYLREREIFKVKMGEAKVLCESGMFPDCQNAAQAYVKIMTGRELGIPATTAMRQLHVVKGRVGLDADLMVALVRKAGKGRIWHDQEEGYCVAYGVRADTGETEEYRWDRERVERSNVAKSEKYGTKLTWQHHESAMLRHRADAELCRSLWPDVVGGLYTIDELAEIEPPEFVEPPASRTEAVKRALGAKTAESPAPEPPDESSSPEAPSEPADGEEPAKTSQAPQEAPESSPAKAEGKKSKPDPCPEAQTAKAEQHEQEAGPEWLLTPVKPEEQTIKGAWVHEYNVAFRNGGGCPLWHDQVKDTWRCGCPDWRKDNICPHVIAAAGDYEKRSGE